MVIRKVASTILQCFVPGNMRLLVYNIVTTFETRHYENRESAAALCKSLSGFKDVTCMPHVNKLGLSGIELSYI